MQEHQKVPIIVRLFEHVGTALIIPCSTGIVYSNQAGGHSCSQPQAEGFLVPIANGFGPAPTHDFRSPENELGQYFEKLNSCGASLTELNAAEIETIMHKLPPWRGLMVDRTRLSESLEAWVFVTIKANGIRRMLVDGLKDPIRAILTWTNSD